ncbi:DUF551 domain-containing protein [Rhizobium sp. 007]|uniref:DUF551 domain-containing protein n=1 Tax=Rhizobium sp. 007 TaxID=2785056 RepID=UPI00188DFBFE|nr:DUF551 domain-containing protein [Rhizobium sp. 007]QPB21158.1 DUF551 domain-containing protein [Rhizobium sp. 007]
MSDWLRIDTAPKDGTRVLLGRFTGDPKGDHEGFVSVDWYRQPEDKQGYVGCGHFSEHYWPPTHWMHLPQPPKVKK